MGQISDAPKTCPMSISPAQESNQLGDLSLLLPPSFTARSRVGDQSFVGRDQGLAQHTPDGGWRNQQRRAHCDRNNCSASVVLAQESSSNQQSRRRPDSR